MHRLRLVLPVVSAVVFGLSANSARCALVDDLEHIGSTNYFGGQWLFSGDWYDNGNSTILSAVDPAEKDKAFKGSYGGGFPEGSTGNAALLHYKMGTVKPVSGGSPYGNQVAMETRFNADYAGTLDLTGATGISFYAIASQKTVVRVSFATANITDWAFYQANITVNTAYQRFAIPLTDFVKPAWGDKTKILDLAKSQAIVWTISTDDNATGFAAEGKLWIDSITVEPFVFKAPPPYGACETCVGAAGSVPAVSSLIADFDGTNPLVNNLGFYWFAYADEPTQPGVDSSVITGAQLTTEGSGTAGTNGGKIDFKLGGSWLYQGQYPVDPGVNVKTELFKATEGAVDATGASGIYFDYKTTGDFAYVKLQVQTGQAFANNEAALPFVMFKSTAGQWQSAYVKWADLVLPKWGEVEALPAEAKVIDPHYLKSLTWTIVDKSNTTGSIALDNVRLVGITTIGLSPLAASAAPSPARPAFRQISVHGRGNGLVSVRAGAHASRLVITDLQGKIVAQPAVVQASSAEVRLNRGSYCVRAFDRTGTSLGTNRIIVY